MIGTLVTQIATLLFFILRPPFQLCKKTENHSMKIEFKAGIGKFFPVDKA